MAKNQYTNSAISLTKELLILLLLFQVIFNQISSRKKSAANYPKLLMSAMGVQMNTNVS